MERSDAEVTAQPVICLTELADRVVTKCYAGDRAVLVFREGNNVSAYSAYCPHQGMELMQSGIDGHTITCGHHGWRFSMPGGTCGAGGGGWDLAPLAVEISNDWVMVRA